MHSWQQSAVSRCFMINPLCGTNTKYSVDSGKVCPVQESKQSVTVGGKEVYLAILTEAETDPITNV